MKHVLTGKCKTIFEYQNDKFINNFLSKEMIQLMILRWFNTKTNICVDILHYKGDGFDYFVTNPIKDEIFPSPYHADNRCKDFDKNLEMALTKANELYNKYN